MLPNATTANARDVVNCTDPQHNGYGLRQTRQDKCLKV